MESGRYEPYVGPLRIAKANGRFHRMEESYRSGVPTEEKFFYAGNKGMPFFVLIGVCGTPICSPSPCSFTGTETSEFFALSMTDCVPCCEIRKIRIFLRRFPRWQMRK
jgi:hypothetical protein